MENVPALELEIVVLTTSNVEQGFVALAPTAQKLSLLVKLAASLTSTATSDQPASLLDQQQPVCDTSAQQTTRL
jgi:hypothetical protein